MKNIKVLLTSFLLIHFSAFAQNTDITKINDWDQLDRYLRSQEPKETVRIYKQVSVRLPKPTWGDDGFESAVVQTTNAYQKLGQTKERVDLFKEAIDRMEDILKQIEEDGDLDDYKDYCEDIGNMCQAAGFKDKQDYYYDQSYNAKPKTKGQHWGELSEKIGRLYMNGQLSEAVTLYESMIAEYGEPKKKDDAYLGILTYMSGIYASLGNTEKSAEIMNKMINLMNSGDLDD